MAQLEEWKTSLKQEALTAAGDARRAIRNFMRSEQMEPGDVLNLPALLYVALRLPDSVRDEMEPAVDQLQAEGILSKDLVLTKDGSRFLY